MGPMNNYSALMSAPAAPTSWNSPKTILCLSHLRWNFVYQRPQHLMSRAARRHHVLFVEEPVDDGEVPYLERRRDPSGVTVVVPHLAGRPALPTMRELLDNLVWAVPSTDLVLWYYTPMALDFSEHLRACAVVYDCMDELSSFAGASPELPAAEQRLLRVADLVLTGGYSLYCAKQALHHNVHEFASGVDCEHFATARQMTGDPPDQAAIPHPRIGFFGVLDERLDLELVGGIAADTPGWHYVLIGPVTKIDPAALPQLPNLHYLGPKTYAELPRYIAGWDVAMLPFACNAATRYISPTKTPEYLAAGKPVVSTPIADVVRSYGDSGMAQIADGREAFVQAIRAALCDPTAPRLARTDAFLATQGWDGIWDRVSERVRAAIMTRRLSDRTATPVARS